MIERVMFVSRTAAENTVGIPDWAVVSISEPDGAFGMARLLPGWYAIHRVAFHDIDAEIRDEAYVLMNVGQAADIVAFVESVAPHVSGILVHCKAGISRSAAVAKWIAERYRLQFNHDYSVYNRHVYRLLLEASGMDQDYGEQE